MLESGVSQGRSDSEKAGSMSFDTIILEMQYERQRKAEEYLRLRIKPRPVWLPKFVHQWLLQRLVVLEELL